MIGRAGERVAVVLLEVVSLASVCTLGHTPSHTHSQSSSCPPPRRGQEARHELGLLAQQRVPADAVEELVQLDLGGTGERTESLSRVVREEALDEVLRVVLGPLDFVLDDVGEQLLGRLAEEGHPADDQLVEDDAQCPPVDRLACESW